MNSLDTSKVIETVNKASSANLALISLLILPFVLKTWSDTLQSGFGIESGTPAATICLGIIALVYLVILLWIARENRKNSINKQTRDKILAYLYANDFKSVSFQNIRKVFPKSYTEEKVELLITKAIGAFPDTLRVSKIAIKDEDGHYVLDNSGQKTYKGGVGRIINTKS